MYSQALKNGKYRFFESYIDPMTMLRKTTSVTMDKNTSQTRKAAQELLRAKIARYEAGTSDTKGITLKSLLKAYEDSAPATLRPQTIDRNVREIKKAVELLGENVRADKLTARYITMVFNKWDAKSVTKNERIKRFSAFLRWAYKMDYIPDVSYLSKLPHYADDPRSRREHKYLEPDELTALLDAMKISIYHDITLFAALSGMRIGEIIALKAANVEERVIHVVETYSNITGMDGPTKTDGSTRDIYIQDELKALMDTITPGDVFYFEQDGHRVHYDAYRKYLSETAAKAISRAITPHYLRHTHTSLLAAKGADLSLISHRLGHADSRVTRDIYLHITNEMRSREEAVLDGLTLVKKA